MDVLIQVLERKNLCFRNFFKLCEKFLDEVSKGDTTNIEQFQMRRQALINVLEQLETEVIGFLDGYKDKPSALDAMMTGSAKSQINFLLREKDATVKAILDLDLQILGHIDRIKDETIQKLQAVHASKKTNSAYRSPIDAVEHAEKSKTLDREA